MAVEPRIRFMKMFMLFLIVHTQCIRNVGGSQGGGYDYYLSSGM